MSVDFEDGLLLDTHMWIWIMNGDETLKAKARKIIKDYSKKSFLYISAISVWEMSVLERKKKHLAQHLSSPNHSKPAYHLQALTY